MLENLQPNQKQYQAPCFVMNKIREHPETTEADVQAVRGYLDDQVKWPVKTLSKALTAQGIFISERPIQRHRDGRCDC